MYRVVFCSETWFCDGVNFSATSLSRWGGGLLPGHARVQLSIDLMLLVVDGVGVKVNTGNVMDYLRSSE